jgi:glycine dehydrogenase
MISPPLYDKKTKNLIALGGRMIESTTTRLGRKYFKKSEYTGEDMQTSIFQSKENSLIPRHIGPDAKEQQEMLKALGYENMDALVKTSIPEKIYNDSDMGVGEALSEKEALTYLKNIASKNKVFKNYIGQGYNPCITPTVIQRNILENPGWYTQYTPYQAEISQGRLEALLNFQTMIADLTGLEIANASLLDEGTAAAEAMSLSKASAGRGKSKFFVDQYCHPQTIEVIKTRALPLGIEIIVGDVEDTEISSDFFGGITQYPNTKGNIQDTSKWVADLKAAGALVTFAADPLALTLLKTPAELGADIAVGTTQRFGLGLFFGGPHAAYMATHEKFKRQIPGRIIGVTKDASGGQALRLALQTREQHIRRDRATSNICTAQVLLAVVAGMYGVYHGPTGLKNIATRVHKFTGLLADLINSTSAKVTNAKFFDTLCVESTEAQKVFDLALSKNINLRRLGQNELGISLDETTELEDVLALASLFGYNTEDFKVSDVKEDELFKLETEALRTSDYMTHPNFNKYHTESEFLRYLTHLQNKDLSLAHSMIPLGSCTMKLNATSEMLPISWPEFTDIHPFAPLDQSAGYQEMFTELEDMIAKITGFDAVSLQPNAGSQGEYAGLLAITNYHKDKGQEDRDICLIPTSAHGTNPASAVMAGLKVVAVKCDDQGNIDINDLKEKSETHKDKLAALMITYPSTHGVFETEVKEICDIIHNNGGLVYLDGANLNAQVGLCRPGEYGPDVCHLNLHKTFSIPHGGGGPGMGPIAVKSILKDYLPGNASMGIGSDKTMGAISAAPWGSSIILNISWAYIKMMGDRGLQEASQVAILNANYIAHRLKDSFPILYTGNKGLVAHECIIDCRHFQAEADITVADIAKRLMDYGYHAPTMSWPVAGTLMIEPTESENKAELDRFCDALISIADEIKEIKEGKADRVNNLLKNAPHTAQVVTSDSWDRPYSRDKAAYPMQFNRVRKFWPSVSRVDDAFGDRNLICSCPTVEELSH